MSVLWRRASLVDPRNYGPTADTGGLMQNNAPTIYAYANLDALLEGAEAFQIER